MVAVVGVVVLGLVFGHFVTGYELASVVLVVLLLAQRS